MVQSGRLQLADMTYFHITLITIKDAKHVKTSIYRSQKTSVVVSKCLLTCKCPVHIVYVALGPVRTAIISCSKVLN